MAATDNKILDGAGLTYLIGLIKSGGGGSSLPDYPTTAGNYQLLLAIDDSGKNSLSWIVITNAEELSV